MSDTSQPGTTVIVVGVLRRGDDVVLVHQFRRQDPYPSWALPGGRAEPGESLADTLRREVQEETGLSIGEIGPILSVTDTMDAVNGNRYLAFVVEVTGWEGELRPADPDGFILSAHFVPRTEALLRLESLVWPDMREPSIAAVREDESPGTIWIYQETGEQQTLVAVHGSKRGSN